ncbi:MAG: tRNA (adenosine(37)-N6)-threonylcarbamoyltransferase complex dimerization subunit type 1 TsaB [Patescibacteria group bacterium]
MILYINTSDAAKIYLALLENGESVHKLEVMASFKHEELLLKSIEEIMRKAAMKLDDISSIAVVHGPGGFSSLRIGVTVANALAYSLQKPIQGVEDSMDIGMIDESKAKSVTEGFIVPVYGAEPNIG